MTKRQFSTLALLMVVAGFLGGAVSDRLLRGDPAAAAAVPGVVTATEFKLVDAEGKGRAALALVDGRPSLGMWDAAGKQRVDLGFCADGSPGLGLADAAGMPRMVLALGAYDPHCPYQRGGMERGWQEPERRSRAAGFAARMAGGTPWVKAKRSS